MQLVYLFDGERVLTQVLSCKIYSSHNVTVLELGNVSVTNWYNLFKEAFH